VGTRACSPGAKWLGHEADHSPPTGAEFENVWSYISTPPHIFMAYCLTTGYAFMAWYLVKHADIFNLLLYK